MRFLLSCLLAVSLVTSVRQSMGAPLPNFQAASSLGQELYERSGATGMVLVIVHENQVFIEGYGQTAPGSGQRPDAHSVIRLCSLTKIFTSDLLTKLALEGKVRLDDPLQKYAPAGFVVPARQQPITLLHLATHTAGLYREVGWPPDGTPKFAYPDYALRWNWLSHQHLRSTPGTFASYSNVGYDLLSDALAQATHRPYANLLHERTLTPLRMWDTTFYPNASQCGRLMVGSQNQGPCAVTANTEGSAGLYSTPTDMARWLRYLVGAPGVPAQPAAAQQVYLNPARQMGLNYAGTPSGLGLGWIHVLPADDPSHIVEKDGGGAGFLTYIVVHPASHSALFAAMTIGRNGYHANLFKASNSVLLKIAGVPTIPEPQGNRIGKGRNRRTLQPAAPTTQRQRKGRSAQAPAARDRRLAPAQPAARGRQRKQTPSAGRQRQQAVPRGKSAKSAKPQSRSAQQAARPAAKSAKKKQPTASRGSGAQKHAAKRRK